MHSSHLRRRELCITFLKAEYLHKLFGICQHKRFLFSPIYLFIQSFIYQSGLMDIYFILWIIIQYYFCYLNGSSFGHWELLVWLLYPWHVPIIVGICFFLWHFLTFFTFCRHKMLQTHLVHFFPSPGVSHVSQEPWFFLLENGKGCILFSVVFWLSFQLWSLTLCISCSCGVLLG